MVECRPRPLADTPLQVPDAAVGQMSHLLDHSGVTALIEAELAGRPGPRGLPIRTVLLGLLLSIQYTGKATLCDAWRLVTFSLSPTAQAHLGLKPINPDDPYERLASSRRFYRAFDRITSVLDPARTDRRTRLPQHKAVQHAAAWEDDDPEHRRRRDLLQTIVTSLILTPSSRTKVAATSRRCRHRRHRHPYLGQTTPCQQRPGLD
ncbi:hypothetical protein ABZU75_09480 [Streptosporangium sp. NPDC005286]|uniref:hypothetical protein n=1 Tax=Streptosporangium sp. NPDC005286 TaxID=3154463 RepID=UPI0033B9341C